jgi:hypothetical protein
MKIIEIITESWWEGLPDGFLAMMGYSAEEQAPEDSVPDQVQSIEQDVQAIRDAS